MAKEHVNKRRVFAAVDAESDIDVESSVPVAGAVANHISVTRGTITLAVYTRHSYSEEKAEALALWNDRQLGIIRGKTAAKVLPLKRTKRGRG